MDAQHGAGRGPGGSFSPGVEGLRGIAVLLVLAFHALPWVAGGFIGVDVFFVISGYLITGLLVRELTATGGIDLVQFYGRRLRRLLPAATVVAIVVLPLGWLAVSPLDRLELVLDGGSAVLIASNVRFAAAAGDYFAAVQEPSPFLHYWSLSLEEQFYLVWPGLLLLVARGGHVRAGATITLVAVGVASLAMSGWLTAAAPSWAFYSLPSRAWQFALGGLLAVGAMHAPALAGRTAALAGWVGMAVIGWAVVVIDGSQPYPGALALLPSVGALLVIAGCAAPSGPALILGCRPLRFLGRISYSLYLWHWPILVIPAAAAGVTLGWQEGLALAGCSIVVAWLSWRFVEEPFRRTRVAGPRLAGLSLRLGAATVAGSLLWAGFFGLAADTSLRAIAASDVPGAPVPGGDGMVEEARQEDAGPVEVLVDDGSVPTSAPDAASDGPAAGEDAAPGEPGSAAADDDATPPDPSSGATPASPATTGTTEAATPPVAATGSLASVPPTWTTIPHRALPDGQRLPAGVQPSLVEARTDQERLMADGCFTGLDGATPARCVYGDRAGAVTVVLIGDSHAAHWFPALNVLANREDWRLVPLVKASCPFVDIPVLNPFGGGVYQSCSTWRDRAIRIANAAHPDLVIVASAYRGIRPAGAALSPRGLGKAMADAIARIKAPVAVIVDNPRTGVDVPACLARHPGDVHRCAIPRWEAVPDTYGVLETVAARRSGATLVDLTSSICPSMPCPVVRDGMILYRDGHHLTATFVRSLAGVLEDRLAPLLAPSPAAVAAPVAPAAMLSPATIAPGSPADPAAAPVFQGEGRAWTPAGPATPPGPAAPAGTLVRDVAVAVGGAGTRALEPVVATHPSDPDVIAVAFERQPIRTPCSGARLEAALAMSRDGGRTWTEPAGLPWAGSNRVPSYHSAVAWGPGPRRGTDRLYWAGTTTLACGGDLRVATSWSDDLGRTWSPLRVVRGTPAWVGGVPDITADTNPASPRHGTVWLAYNYPLPSHLGAGVRVEASTDFGRSWRGVSVQRAPAPAGFPHSWRFGHRVRTAPDGSAYVSWYQADLRRWSPNAVFERGPGANVGRMGFVVARVRIEGGRLRVARPVLVAGVPANPWTLGDRPAAGTRTHTYADPMWAHGLAVDPAMGTVHLAAAVYAPAPDGGVRGRIVVARSTDHGRTWEVGPLPSVPAVRGVAQSSWRPGIVARDGVVLVALRTLDDVPGARSAPADARIGTAWSVSRDGGRTFATPVVVAGSRWPASRLAGVVNGPGIRERVELAADGSAVLGYGRAAGAGRSEVHVAIVGLPGPVAAPDPARAVSGGGRVTLLVR